MRKLWWYEISMELRETDSRSEYFSLTAHVISYRLGFIHLLYFSMLYNVHEYIWLFVYSLTRPMTFLPFLAFFSTVTGFGKHTEKCFLA